mgnify:CR=1 FL=1
MARAKRVFFANRLTVVGNVLRAPAGEQQRQFGARQTWPRAYPVGIDMHEGNGRGWIVPDAAALVNQRRIAQLPDRYVGEMRHAAVPRMWRLSLACPPTVLRSMLLVSRERKPEMIWIRFRRPELGVDLPEEIDQIGIHLGGFRLLRQSRSIQLIFCMASGRRLPPFMYWMVSVSLVWML